MNSFSQKISTALVVCLVMFASSFQAMADDTEIFFSSVSLSGSTSIQPNVLLVLDTSSSMNTQVGDTGMNRLEHMKEALHTILDNTNNINVGLMRFHGKGGPVLFPVSDINAEVDTVFATTPGAPQTFNRIKNGTDDVEETILGTASASEDLTFGKKEFTTTCGDSSNITKTFQISDGADDVEEVNKTGNVDASNDALNIIKKGKKDNQHVGLRFNNVTIPKGAEITCAYLDFEVKVKERKDADLDIYIEQTNDASPFNAGNGTDDVSDRILSGDPFVAWDNALGLNAGETLTSPDVASLVKSVVDRGGWFPGNSMAFIINGAGKRIVQSYEGDASGAAVLRVEYSGGAIPANQKVGLRFSDVKIPQGTTITAAYIDFTSVNETLSEALKVEISAEAVDNSAAFNLGLLQQGVTTKLASASASSPVTWDMTTWEPNNIYSTPDIKDLVQDIVDRGNWCGGNAMSFMFKTKTGNGPRIAVSDDGDQGVSPALRIEYDETTATGCNTYAVQAQIKTGNDDAEEETSSGNIDLSSSDLELHSDGGTDQIIGMRFQDINIAAGDTIVSAELEFTVDETDSGSTSVTIFGEDAGDSQPFSSTNKISARSLTSASVAWSPGSWDTVGDKHVSPDVTAIVQEIIAHSGWSALNNMSFIIKGTSGERTAESHNGDPARAPKLRINVKGLGLGSGGSAGITTVRQKLHDIVDEIAYKSGTPIVDTLYEAGAYYRGEEVFYGRTRGGAYALDPLSESIGSRSEYTRVSHQASYTGAAPTRDGACNEDNLSSTDCVTERIVGDATYISPIEYECQDNHIVFLSDGSPSRWSLNEVSSPYFGSTSSCAGSSDWRGLCGEEIISFLQNNDQIDDSTLSDTQNITTHTIGFNFAGSTYLQDLASAGGGGFYEADTAAQLADRFSQIFADVLASPTSFVAPAVTINTFNRLSHRDELYFALFEPDDSPRWHGNVKRYRLDTSSGNAVIVDAEDNPAVDGSSGYFTTSAESWWSGFADGQEIKDGGFAGELGTSRNLYTYTGSEATLSDSINHLKNTNNDLTNAMLDIVNEQATNNNFRANMLSWIGGTDVLDEDEDNSTSDARQYVGDPLHSRPALITYGKDANDDPDTVAYFGTNEGFIHALDVDDGSEIFAFMPPELLPNIKGLMANQGTPADHKYGVDGTITPWVYDANGDNDLEDTGDHVYLYTGMRRGGNNYYALDVTDRNAPELLWTINGGSGDFAELGQTWSQPVKSKVDIGGTVKDVLIFAGGYDENQDSATTSQVDNVGRALYIVDANTGARLWWAGPASSSANLEIAELKNSMPAKPAVIDLDVDGKADHVYIGDLGGKVWRFDFNHGSNADAFGNATLFATLGDTDGSTGTNADNDLENNRRFYHTPSVAFKDPLASQTLYVAIGSGFHAHPLNQDAHDRVYVLEDKNVITGASVSFPLTESVLFNATNNAIQDGSDQATIDAAIAARNTAPGWYLLLEEDSSTQIGEKALSRPTIYDNVLIFSTYLPEDPGATVASASCQAAAGFGRTYAMSLDDASSVFNFDASISALDKADRYVTLNHVGIPPEVQIIIPEGSLTHGRKPVLLVGTEIVDSDFDSPAPEMIYWSDQ